MADEPQRPSFEELRALQMKFRRLGYPRKFDVMHLLKSVEEKLREGSCEDCRTLLSLSETVKARRTSNDRLGHPSVHHISWALQWLGAIKSKHYDSWAMPDMEPEDV